MSYTAKSVIFDIADNYGNAYFLGIRQIDFYLSGSKLAIPNTVGAIFDATTDGGGDYRAENAFDTTYSKTGSPADTTWTGSYQSITDQRVIINFDSEQAFDEIRINNYHSSGSSVDRGANNVKIYIYDSAVYSTTYGNSVGDYDLIFDSTFTEHTASDVEDEETLSLLSLDTMNIVTDDPSLGTPEISLGIMDIVTIDPVLGTPELSNSIPLVTHTVKSVIIDVADNHGDTDRMGIRSIDFYYQGSLISLSTSDFIAYATSYAAHQRFIFDTSLSKIGSATSNGWLTPDGTNTNQRISVAFVATITFDSIIVNNYHHYGGDPTRGANNVNIYVSDSSISSTVYEADTDDYEKIFTGTFDEHSAVNEIDNDLLVLFGPLANPADILTAPPHVAQTKDPSATLTMDILCEAPVVPEVDSIDLSAKIPRSCASVIFDFADNYGDGSYIGIRSIDFYYQAVLKTVVAAGFVTDATTEDVYYDADRPFNIYTTKTGVAEATSWRSTGAVTNQRLLINFTSLAPFVFDTIKVNNYHDSGIETDIGVQNVKIYTSNLDVSNTVYNDDVDDYNKIYDGVFSQHTTNDSEQTQTLNLLPGVMDIITLSPIIPGVDILYKPNDILTEAPVVGIINTTTMNILSGVPLVAETEEPPTVITKLDIAIPLDVQFFNGNNLTESFPSFDFQGTLFSGQTSDVSLTFPKISYAGYFGALVETEFSSLSFSGDIANDILCQINLSFPKVGYSSKSSFLSNGDFNLNFKSLQGSFHSLVGNRVSLSGTLPKISFLSFGFSGNVVDIESFLSLPVLEINSIITGENLLELTFPEFSLLVVADKLSCFNLTYVKGKVR